MRTFAQFLLFVLTVTEMALGLVAGTVALAGLITESLARVATRGSDRFAARCRLARYTPQLRNDLAAVFAAMTTPGGTR